VAGEVKVLNGDKLRRQLGRLAKESERTVESALSRLAFEVKDEVQKDVAEAFDWSSEATKKFIAGGFRVRYTKGQKVFRAIIYPLSKAAEILARYQENTRLTARDKADLTFEGKIAIPLRAIPRGPRGTIPKSMHPHRLVDPDSKGRAKAFVTESGKAIFMRVRGGGTEPAFALEDSTETRKRIDVKASAAKAVGARAGAAFADAIRRAMQRAGMLK